MVSSFPAFPALSLLRSIAHTIIDIFVTNKYALLLPTGKHICNPCPVGGIRVLVSPLMYFPSRYWYALHSPPGLQAYIPCAV